MPQYSSIEEIEAGTDLHGNVPGWGFTLWSDLLDDEAPHRNFLGGVVAVCPGMKLELPEFEPYEDYVQGALEWEGNRVSVYYETMFSHLWLWSPNRTSVESLRGLIVEVLSQVY